MLKKILLGIVILVVLAQFIRPSLNKGDADGPTGITQLMQVPDTIHTLLKAACYDCHSNNTSYPWYSRITPVNWWMKNHVDDGKKELNFSIYTTYNAKQKEHKMKEIIETVKEHEMPIGSYLWMHKEARLSDEQRAALTQWASLARQQLLSGSLTKE
jgi:hypothetical protein